MMKIAILSLFLVFMSCGSSKSAATQAEIINLKQIVATKNITASFDWARPLGLMNNVTGIENLLPPGSTANSINLIGNPNFFRIKNDSIHMDLPYYGQQQLGGGYNSDSGVKFEGAIKKEKQLYDKEKEAYVLEYWLNAKNENYSVVLTLFANNKSSLNVNSSHRTNISYDGSWEEYKEKKN
ncbi:DUF4251 domain-containing protein [uncultured Polaribacter sp.]|uniref:DUF4251 domain-containing protein n=1 Tax=uncultured Polaribacter sp. TaxID=174711 RepID=UPI00262AEAF6|nr:DUF4251 domain-containing protein [uncultured Polaribacter sp.]